MDCWHGAQYSSMNLVTPYAKVLVNFSQTTAKQTIQTQLQNAVHKRAIYGLYGRPRHPTVSTSTPKLESHRT